MVQKRIDKLLEIAEQARGGYKMSKPYEEYMLGKIDSGEELTETELSELCWNFNVVDISYGENRRWSRSIRSIIEICGRYFALDWEAGLTEYQENEFYNQPVEVEKKEYTKTITVTEWNEIKKK